MVWKLELASDKDATTWEDITALVDWTTMQFGGTANRGEIDTGSGFDLADDAGARTLPKHRRVRLIETATTPDTVMWQGRTATAGLARVTRWDGLAKAFDIGLQDVNADFGGIAFAQTPRPAETDIERIRFLLDTYIGDYISPRTRPSTAIADTYFAESDPTDLAAYMYSGVQLIEFFRHIVESSGRQFFLTKDYELFYASDTNTAYAAGLSITDAGTADGITSFAPTDPTATEDGTELFTRVRFRYSGNRVVQVIRPLTEAANDQWATVVVDEEVTTNARAMSRADQFLREFDHEQVSYRCAIDLKDDQVDLIAHGMTVSYRAAATAVTTPTTLRVSRLSWERISNATTDGRWRAHLELNYPTKFGRRSKPGTPPATAPLPFVPGTPSSAPLTQVKTVNEQVAATVTLDSGDGWAAPTAGHLLVAWHSVRSGTAFTLNTPAGWTAHPTGTVDGGVDRAGMYYRIADGSESSITFGLSGGTRHALTVAEFATDATLDDDGETTGTSATITTGSVTPTSGQAVLIVGGAVVNTSDSFHSMTPGVGWTELADEMVDGPSTPGSGFHPLHWMAYQQVASASGSYNPTGTVSAGTPAFGGQTLAFTLTATDDDTGHPVQGQQITEPMFVWAGTEPTTSYPYAPSSLIVTSNGIDVSDAVEETDPAAGVWAFSTGNEPFVGSEIVVRYLSTGLTL